ncbi:MAG: hypothetical protein ABJB03_08280 [Rhodoglobus sp.]
MTAAALVEAAKPVSKPARSAVVGIVALCLILSGCSALPGEHGTPPPGSRDALVAHVIASLDAQDPGAMAELFPSQSTAEMAAVFADCGVVSPAGRGIPNVEEVVPYDLTVYLTGHSTLDNSPAACWFGVSWQGTAGPWTIRSETIDPAKVPTCTPRGECDFPVVPLPENGP